MASSLKRPLQNDDVLYFIHIPKCAGTSFISLLDEHYVFDEIFPIHHDLHRLVSQISDQKLRQYVFIRGHFPYDLIVPRLLSKPRIITFLREPATRFLSHFLMRQRHGFIESISQAERVTDLDKVWIFEWLENLHERLARLSLEEFLEHPNLIERFANQATWLIGGVTKGKDGRPVPNLELAKERLAEMDFVGIVERYEESLELFCYIFDFPRIEVERRLNVSPDREKRKEIRAETLERIAEIEWADRELYRFGYELFEQRYRQMKREEELGVGYPLPEGKERVEEDFSRVDPGQGWHVGERHPKYGVVRWSGPETVSRLRYVLQPGRDWELRICVVNAIAEDVLASLKVTVNGESVMLVQRERKEDGVVEFVGHMSDAIARGMDGWTRLSFEVNRTASPGGQDERLLGLCYNKLLITPVKKVR